jgi:hypothetical protein
LDQFSKTLDKYKKIAYNIEVLYKQAPLISRMSKTFREYVKGGTDRSTTTRLPNVAVGISET